MFEWDHERKGDFKIYIMASDGTTDFDNNSSGISRKGAGLGV